LIGRLDRSRDDPKCYRITAVFPTVDGSFRYAVDTEGYGALQFFAEEKLALAVARQGAT